MRFGEQAALGWALTSCSVLPSAGLYQAFCFPVLEREPAPLMRSVLVIALVLLTFGDRLSLSRSILIL